MDYWSNRLSDTPCLTRNSGKGILNRRAGGLGLYLRSPRDVNVSHCSPSIACLSQPTVEQNLSTIYVIVTVLTAFGQRMQSHHHGTRNQLESRPCSPAYTNLIVSGSGVVQIKPFDPLPVSRWRFPLSLRLRGG